MFKRMSVLRRRPGDEPAHFARHWQSHGELVARLPGVRGYIQNIVDDVLFETSPQQGVKADGFVELYFDDPEGMHAAFSSGESVALKADEPHFLGHATGYCIAEDRVPGKFAHEAKFIVTLSGPGSPRTLDALRARLAPMPGFAGLEHDTVSELIARREPQPVDVFAHAFFTDAPDAQALATRVKTNDADVRLALFRVRASTVVPRSPA